MSDKFAFVEFNRPAQARFQGVGRLVQLVSVETVASFQPQRIARSQPGRQQSTLFPGSQQVTPQLDHLGRWTIQFKAVLSGVASARNNALDAIHLARLKM